MFAFLGVCKFFISPPKDFSAKLWCKFAYFRFIFHSFGGGSLVNGRLGVHLMDQIFARHVGLLYAGLRGYVVEKLPQLCQKVSITSIIEFAHCRDRAFRLSHISDMPEANRPKIDLNTLHS